MQVSGNPDKGNWLMTYARIVPLAILDHSFPAWQTLIFILLSAHCTGSYVASFETRIIYIIYKIIMESKFKLDS